MSIRDLVVLKSIFQIVKYSCIMLLKKDSNTFTLPYQSMSCNDIKQLINYIIWRLNQIHYLKQKELSRNKTKWRTATTGLWVLTCLNCCWLQFGKWRQKVSFQLGSLKTFPLADIGMFFFHWWKLNWLASRVLVVINSS